GPTLRHGRRLQALRGEFQRAGAPRRDRRRGAASPGHRAGRGRPQHRRLRSAPGVKARCCPAGRAAAEPTSRRSVILLDSLSLVILLLRLTVTFYAFIFVHDIPYKIAKARQHPYTEAIHVAGWLSLFTLHAIWPFVWIWAVSYKKPEAGQADGG